MQNSRYAYVTMLYGDNDYFLGTLIFILSLLKTKPKYDTVLLYTFDVPTYKLDILKKYYTRTKEITYIQLKHKIRRKRFQNIFTKLKIFTLIDYEKILYLDNDMYVQKNLDHIFHKYNTPAGLGISEDLEFKDNEKVHKNKVVFNAGTWLIKPSIKDFKRMLSGIKNFNTNNELEQEYVSYFYNKKWTNMSYKYNYQFGLASFSNNKRGQLYDKINNGNLNDIYIIHYSAPKKPWNYLLNDELRNKNQNFRNDFKFYGIWINLFIKTYKKFIKNNLNLLDLLSQFNDIEKYLRRKYPNMKIHKLNDHQKIKLNQSVNRVVIGSSNVNSDKDLTYKDILKFLLKINNNVFITGGAIRSIFNDENIGDLDINYNISPDLLEDKLKKMKIKYKRGSVLPSYFKIGSNPLNDIDLFFIDKIDDSRDSPCNYLMYNFKDKVVYDPFGIGVEQAKEKIFCKPPNLSYDEWLNAHGLSNLLLGRMIKFIFKGYKTYKNDRIRIYNDWFYNKTRYYFQSMDKCLVNIKDEAFKYIIDDIDSLNLKFNGRKFINKLNKCMK